jgi:hypothetical protein
MERSEFMTSGDSPHPFDLLRFDVLWEARLYFDIFDQEARLSVRAEATGPEPWQRDAFDLFRRIEEHVKPRVYAEILAYYQSIIRDYRAQFSAEFLHLAPRVSSVEEVRRLITPEAVYIDDVRAEDGEVALLYDCTWDDSHGLGVRLAKGEVAEVGPQDICL